MTSTVSPVRSGEKGTDRATLRRRACAIIAGVDELADCLRHWRDRLDPAELGLPAGRRRAPGLRREEVARLAGVSVDYLSRLEQGRAANPSPSVLAALARTLRLTHEERAHLFRVAGHVETEARRIDRHITPGVQRILDRLADVPVMVVDAAWEIVALNPLATALLGDLSAGSPRERTSSGGTSPACSRGSSAPARTRRHPRPIPSPMCGRRPAAIPGTSGCSA
jgi:transcriptional regulator with XRE-family HTH domain